MYKGVDLASQISVSFATYLRDNGFGFAIRYLDDSFGKSWKATKQPELDILKTYGLGYVPIFETTGASGVDGTPVGAAYFSMNQGMYDGQHALYELDGLKYPDGFPVIFSCDTDLRGADLASLRPYCQGLKDILGDRYPIWFYGPFDVLAWLKTYCADLVKGYYQAYAPAWSNGRNTQDFPNVDIRQVRNGVQLQGVEVDLDIGLSDGWKGGTEPVTPEDKQWMTDNILLPIMQKLDSGFNTTLPTLINREAAGDKDVRTTPVDTDPARP